MIKVCKNNTRGYCEFGDCRKKGEYKILCSGLMSNVVICEKCLKELLYSIKNLNLSDDNANNTKINNFQTNENQALTANKSKTIIDKTVDTKIVESNIVLDKLNDIKSDNSKIVIDKASKVGGTKLKI